MAPKKRLGEMLLEAGIIDVYTLDRALDMQKKSGRKLGTVLMQEGLIDERFLEGATLFAGTGCPQCMETGYLGRVAAYEVLFLSNPLRDMIKNRAGAAQIKEAAIGEGLLTMTQDGQDKVRQGITTLEEVRRVLLTEGA